MRDFQQVDVFGTGDCLGNPVAVVLAAEGLDDEQMQRFARWTNLSETTFVLPAENPVADYRVRIFTPGQELPFAGHPTLGTCHAWLQAGGQPKRQTIVQECEAGLVEIRRDELLAFAAPPLVRGGDVEPEEMSEIMAVLGVTSVVDAQWVDNGPGWVAVLLEDDVALAALRPTQLDGYNVGAVAVVGGEARVRAFFDDGGVCMEDPVTGSLNASLAPWLVDSGRLSFPYTARQGAALGRDGEVRLSRDPDGTVWVAGRTTTIIRGAVRL